MFCETPGNPALSCWAALPLYAATLLDESLMKFLADESCDFTVVHALAQQVMMSSSRSVLMDQL